jgi:hypothetical protein
MSEKPQPASEDRDDQEERAGELIVERLRKDDGRTLIAYWRERPKR